MSQPIKRVILTTALAIGLGTAAHAADLGPGSSLSPFTWTGFYVGGNVGGAWGDAHSHLSTPGGGFPLFVPDDAAAIAHTGSGSFNSRDVTAGVQAGYNYQMDRLVVGAEVGWNWLGLDDSFGRTAPTPGAGVQATRASFSADDLVTLRGRLGWTFGRALIYATGGAAFSNIDFHQSTSFSGVPTVDNFRTSDDRWGWTVGGGAEWAFAPHWTLKGEYLHVDLGSLGGGSTATSPYGPPNTVPFNHRLDDLTAELVIAGINYKF